MSGDHLNKLSRSTATLTNNSLISSHDPVKLAHDLTQLNQRYVKLNVGGRLFSTSIDTLTKSDSMLRAMFSTRIDVYTDSDGFILIDRCGRHFEAILNYLRDEDVQGLEYYMENKSEADLHELLKEAKFYCIQSMSQIVERKIASTKKASEPFFGSSMVSMVTSKTDLTRMLNSSEKPFIRLLINRHNNKYSYTANSDDNLLKNVELFERMVIKFKNRIMFCKDTTSTEEICCWYFHGGGRKLAEVCCTSIVYTTEKKQTKVEFPDSKILEEIFVNAVLFECKDSGIENSTQVDETLDLSEEIPRISLVSSCVASVATDNITQSTTPISSLSTSTVSTNLVQSNPIQINNGSNLRLTNTPNRRSNR